MSHHPTPGVPARRPRLPATRHPAHPVVIVIDSGVADRIVRVLGWLIGRLELARDALEDPRSAYEDGQGVDSIPGDDERR